MVSLPRLIGLMVIAGVLGLSAAAVPAYADDAATSGVSLLGPTKRYSATASTGVAAQLDYIAGGPSLVFGFGDPGKPLGPMPSLDEQGRILDALLGRLLAEYPDLPPHFTLFLGASRDDLVDALDRRLAMPGANWNPKRGRPRHGPFGAVLTQELAAVLQASPLAKAAEAHGYRLRLTGVNRIDIEPVAALHDARLPRTIDVMTIEAVRIPGKG